MLFKESKNKSLPTIILLHGGGLSWWSLKPVVEQLTRDFHLVTPIIDGHGEDGNQTFISIEDSARKLINYIEQQCDGKVSKLQFLSVSKRLEKYL
jgi:predicted esterase